MNENKRNTSLSFGRYLRAVRVEKGISLEEVSWETKIGMENLLLIEKEDLSALPAEVFVKGFLRSYARAVGADGDRAVNNYASSLHVFKTAARSEADLNRLGTRFWPHMFLVIGVFLCIIGVSVFVTTVFQETSPTADKDTIQAHDAKPVVDPSGNDPAQNLAAKTPAKPETVPQVFPEPVEESRAAVEENETDTVVPEAEPEIVSVPDAAPEKLQLGITTIEDTWIKIIIDGEQPREYSLKPGDHLELEAEADFNILIGNAGGIRMRLNDQPFRVPGQSGQVMTVKIP